MKPFTHARNSARRHGGVPADYQAIHDFFDSTKAALPDMRHRALLHSCTPPLASSCSSECSAPR
jgi:hypothetical protein